jgi:hypothetical protein
MTYFHSSKIFLSSTIKEHKEYLVWTIFNIISASLIYSFATASTHYVVQVIAIMLHTAIIMVW